MSEIYVSCPFIFPKHRSLCLSTQHFNHLSLNLFKTELIIFLQSFSSLFHFNKWQYVAQPTTGSYLVFNFYQSLNLSPIYLTLSDSYKSDSSCPGLFWLRVRCLFQCCLNNWFILLLQHLLYCIMNL